MKNYFFIILLFLCSCSPTKKLHKESFESLISLVDSTQIIRMLLIQNKLGQILESHDPEQLDLLINNFSPAQIAFESEVLTTTVPLVVVYYFKNNVQEQEFIKQLDTFVAGYDDKVKCVIIDADKLFSLAQDAEIETFPAMVLVKNRNIIDKIIGNVTMDSLRIKINKLNNNES